ncbi:PREDICTED: methyltransferase-like protein 13 [Priapulus caudatus]|uniref:Methyltransferase-like protein 13 n=1 Tax=Priapulus caudatus TaxID=37621 RepID=A0ABM1DU01_PRICU|nr:PREDICTED: methyltransferase-like protein 13 [Priapulus caudatus]
MFDNGFIHITNVDYSDVVIQNMALTHEHCCSEMKWKVMDIRDMSEFQSSTFDVVIEKGTLDAMLVEEKDPWHLSDDGKALTTDILSEVARVTTQCGKFISVTFSQPHFRVPLLMKVLHGWSVQPETFGNAFSYFFYVATKGRSLGKKFPTVCPLRADVRVEEARTRHASAPREDFLLSLDL